MFNFNLFLMKFYLMICALLCTLPIMAQNSLSGKVTAKDDTKGIPDVAIYIQDLHLGATTDENGHYSFSNLPKGSYILEIHCLGFSMKPVLVKIDGAIVLDLSLEPTSREMQEVVVTGNTSGKDIQYTPQAVTAIPHSYLIQNASTNCIDAIALVPGVSGISDGQSIMKPVIRGLGYNRVVTVNDGIVQQGQQWGDEFGIEIDPYAIDRVEILKGPASLIYGSDAISGVINFLPENTLPEGQIKGEVLSNYQTNNGLIGLSAHLAGNNNGFTWSGRISSSMAHAYQNKYDGYVLNSQFNNFSYDGTIGLHRSWGYSQIHFSYFELQTGIVDGTRDSATGKLMHQLDINGNPVYVIPSHQEYVSYTPTVINQIIKHYKTVWDNCIAVGNSKIIARFSWQQNHRNEYNDPTTPDIAPIAYLLNSGTYDFRYVSPDWKGFNFSGGVNGLYQDSKNKGTLLLIPEYYLFDIGGFFIANKHWDKLNISAGIRMDRRTFKGLDSYIDSAENPVSANTPGALHRFVGYNSNFNGLSGSLGATYAFTDHIYLKANIAKGFRAPNVAESGSNGIHDGTVVYEIGNPNLKPEENIELDITPGINTKNFSLELNMFVNNVSNFIFPKAVLDKEGRIKLDSSTAGFGPAPVFNYTQSNAMLSGAELAFSYHPTAIKWLDLYAAYSVVNAHLLQVPDSVKYLPFTPPARLQGAITFTLKHLTNTLNNTYFRFGAVYNFEQKNIYLQSATYNAFTTASTPYEFAASHSPTAAYTLLNAGIGTDFLNSLGHKVCSMFISCNNLLDIGYMDYMSRFKYLPVNYANSYRVGVYNMGRNISFKLLIPLNFK